MIKIQRFILIVIGFLVTTQTFSQNFPEGFDYQGILRAESGMPIINTSIDVKIGISTGVNFDVLVYEELHTSSTNENGYYNLIVSNGTNTGAGLVTDFESINWSSGNYAINVKIDQGNGFEDFGNNKLFSVPFAYYAKSAENQLYLNNLMDVDTSFIETGDILRWNGNNWAVYPYSDTVLWATNAINALNSNFSDTSQYAYSALSCPPCDSAIFGFYGDSAMWAAYSDTANISNSSIYADTATVALFSPNAWNIGGNFIENEDAIIGSLDSTDVRFKTNDIERLRITSDGKIGIGTVDPLGDFHVNGQNAVMFTGQHGEETSYLNHTGSGFLWLPSKSAVRMGYSDNNSWSISNIGEYSFAGGFNSRARGKYSFAYGEGAEAIAEGSIALGYSSKSSGVNSIAVGSDPTASGYGSIAMGRLSLASDSMSIALGYQNNSTSKNAIALGYQSKSEAENSIAIGYRARTTHNGAIVFSDASTHGNSNAYTLSELDNQFLVRASGGTKIYSDADMTTGVSLSSGSGSWSSLSDSTLKENIGIVNTKSIVESAKQVDVYTWNYIAQDDSIRHIGPMAQDFYAAFGLGESDKTISIVDFDGINLLLLKALIEKEEVLSVKIEELGELENKIQSLSESYEELLLKVLQLQ